MSLRAILALVAAALPCGRGMPVTTFPHKQHPPASFDTPTFITVAEECKLLSVAAQHRLDRQGPIITAGKVYVWDDPVEDIIDCLHVIIYRITSAPVAQPDSKPGWPANCEPCVWSDNTQIQNLQDVLTCVQVVLHNIHSAPARTDPVVRYDATAWDDWYEPEWADDWYTPGFVDDWLVETGQKQDVRLK